MYIYSLIVVVCSSQELNVLAGSYSGVVKSLVRESRRGRAMLLCTICLTVSCGWRYLSVFDPTLNIHTMYRRPIIWHLLADNKAELSVAVARLEL